MESWNHTSADAVRAHVPEGLNRPIDERVEACVCAMAERGRPEVTAYLALLEREWDVERGVLVGGSALALVGLLLGRRGRAALGVLSAGLLLQQGLVGHGPLSALARLMGLRTRREIDLEKFALKALRGDFSRIPHDAGPLARANAALVAAQS